jgi:hypothetical protein
VAGLKSQPPISKSQIALLIGGLIVLGAMAWSAGWGAHFLLDRQTTQPTTEPTLAPAALPSVAHSPTDTPSPSPTPAATQPQTSTPLPTAATSPTAEHNVEVLSVIASDRGLYDVVRRACGLPKSHILLPTDEIMQETRRLNGLVVKNPGIHPGQEIQVPTYLCP